MPQQRRSLVKPPRQQMGGGAAPAFGSSGAPLVPIPDTERARELAIEYADDERGRFTERVFKVPPFNALAPGGPSVPAAIQSQSVQAVSNRTSFVRLVAIRGVLQNSSVTPLTGLEAANLGLQVQINSQENLVTNGAAQAGNAFVTFAEMFSDVAAPWFWFAAPPRMRVSDTVQVTVVNLFPVAAEVNLTPAVSIRFVDEDWWMALYGGG